MTGWYAVRVAMPSGVTTVTVYASSPDGARHLAANAWGVDLADVLEVEGP